MYYSTAYYVVYGGVHISHHENFIKKLAAYCGDPMQYRPSVLHDSTTVSCIHLSVVLVLTNLALGQLVAYWLSVNNEKEGSTQKEGSEMNH